MSRRNAGRDHGRQSHRRRARQQKQALVSLHFRRGPAPRAWAPVPRDIFPFGTLERRLSHCASHGVAQTHAPPCGVAWQEMRHFLTAPPPQVDFQGTCQPSSAPCCADKQPVSRRVTKVKCRNRHPAKTVCPFQVAAHCCPTIIGAGLRFNSRSRFSPWTQCHNIHAQPVSGTVLSTWQAKRGRLARHAGR